MTGDGRPERRRSRRPPIPLSCAFIFGGAPHLPGKLGLSRLDVLAEFGVVLAGSILLALVAARMLVAPVIPSFPAGDASLSPASDPQPAKVVP